MKSIEKPETSRDSFYIKTDDYLGMTWYDLVKSSETYTFCHT